MERIIATIGGRLTLPADVWAFALAVAVNKAKGLPAGKTAMTTSLHGAEYVVGLSDDHDKIAIIKTPDQRGIDRARIALTTIDGEVGGLTLAAKSDWPDNDPDADARMKRKVEATERLGVVEAARAEHQAVIDASAPVRLELSIEELTELIDAEVVVGFDRGESDGGEPDALSDEVRSLASRLELVSDERDMYAAEVRSLSAQLDLIASTSGATPEQSVALVVGDTRAERDTLAESNRKLVENIDRGNGDLARLRDALKVEDLAGAVPAVERLLVVEEDRDNLRALLGNVRERLGLEDGDNVLEALGAALARQVEPVEVPAVDSAPAAPSLADKIKTGKGKGKD